VIVGKYILIVEADDLVRGLLERWLREAGYIVQAVELGAIGRHAGADLLIANVPNPTVVAPLVAALRANSTTPILLISARLRRRAGSTPYIARELGVQGVLAKPFTRAELLAAVSDALRDASNASQP
jgi:DNA-binding response OmpR family regulator